MFVRSKKMNGAVYYQVVHGYRDPITGKVHHRTRLSLGRQPTIKDALESEREGLANFREVRSGFGAGPFVGRAKREVERLDRRIDESTRRIGVLTDMAKVFPDS